MGETKKSPEDTFIENIAIFIFVGLPLIAALLYGAYLGLAWLVAQFMNQISAYR